MSEVRCPNCNSRLVPEKEVVAEAKLTKQESLEREYAGEVRARYAGILAEEVIEESIKWHLELIRKHFGKEIHETH